MLGNLAIEGLKDPSKLVYVNVVGNDIGPKFTPIGSLATLLWIHMLERKGGIKVTVSQYMKVGFAVGLPSALLHAHGFVVHLIVPCNHAVFTRKLC